MANEQKEIDIWQLVLLLWCNKKQIFIYGVIGAIIGIVVAFSIPKEYVSSVVVAPEKSTQSGGSLAGMGGLASMMGVNIGSSSSKGINEKIYPEILKSSPFIDEFKNIRIDYNEEEIMFFEYLTEKQKYPWWDMIRNLPNTVIGWVTSSEEDSSDNTEQQDSVERKREPIKPSNVQLYFESSFSNRIKLTQDKKNDVISISVTMQDPKVATIIADSLMLSLERYMINYQTKKIAQDLANTQKTFSEAKQDFYKADSIYASTQDKNQNLVTKTASVKINRLKDERNLAYSVYEQLANKVEALKINLQEETPVMTVIQPARVPRVPISPKKGIIIVGLMFLGGFVAIGKIAFKFFFNSNTETTQI